MPHGYFPKEIFYNTINTVKIGPLTLYYWAMISLPIVIIVKSGLKISYASGVAVSILIGVIIYLFLVTLASSQSFNLSTAITNVIQPDLCFTQILNTNPIAEEIKILSLYPNPSDAFFTIHYNINQSGTVHLKIIDLTGKELKNFTTSKHSGIWTERYPTDDLPNGTYIVTITSDNSITTQKLIISH